MPFIDHLKRCWRGEEKLWKVFWLWFVFINTAWYFLEIPLNDAIYSHQKEGGNIPLFLTRAVSWYVPIFIYYIYNPIVFYFILVCAKNSLSPIFGEVAQLIIVLAGIATLLLLFIGLTGG